MKKQFMICAAVAATLFSACSPEQEDFFSDSSANRADQTIVEDMKVLTSAPNGWAMKYFPSRSQSYGGFNFVVSFDNDGNVTFSGEPDIAGETTKTALSLYSVSQSSGVVLSFDSYNAIFSKMADPGAPIAGSAGEGMGGDNEFSILSACADSVVLKGRASGNRAVLYPMAEGQSWSDYLDSLGEVDGVMYGSSYTLVMGTDSFSVATDMRGLTITYIEDGNYVDTYASYIITKDGMEFYSPLELNGKKINGFKLDQDGDKKFTCVNDESVQLLVDPINKQFVHSLWGCAKENMGEYGQLYWKKWESAQKTASYFPGEIALACFGAIGRSFGFVIDIYDEATQDENLGIVYYTYELVGDDEVILTCTTTGDDYGSMMYADGCNYGCFPFGTMKPMHFKLSSDNLKKGIDLQCLTETKVGLKKYNNDFHLTKQFTLWPLRDPADRED